MQNVLITGATGFAGSHLAALLHAQKQYTIHGTYLSGKSENHETIDSSVTLHQLDLHDKQAIHTLIATIRPDIIFHLAAFAVPSESFKDPALFIENNVVSQVHLLEALRTEQLLDTKILVVSSAEVYGMVSSEDIPISEETTLRPNNPYAVSKLAQDFLGLQYFLSYGMPIYRVRPFNHIGPRLSPQLAVSSFAKQIAEIEKKKKEPVLFVGNLDAKRDFTDVGDMVRAYDLVIAKGKAGDVYNIGSGVSHKMKDIVSLLLSFSSTPITLKEDPDRMRPSDIPDLVCDNRKVMATTGWKPTIALEESLKTTLDYWRNIV